MLEHRFQELIAQPHLTATAVAGSAGFVACPGPVLAIFSPVHMGYIAEIYRVAQELAKSELQRNTTRSRIPAFSVN